MKRLAVFVRISSAQVNALGEFLAFMPPGDAKAALAKLHQSARDALMEDVGDLITQAWEQYAKDSQGKIEVDYDAPISRATHGDWVGTWAWIERTKDKSPQAASA